MSKLTIYDHSGKEIGTQSVEKAVFAAKPREHLVALAVTAYQAKGRCGTAEAKTRAEIRGGGAKPWKQKGTGRARAGTRTSPLWNGGGVVFPPKQRSYAKHTSQREKQEALKSALSMRLEDTFLYDQLKFDVPSTKTMKQFLNVLGKKSLLLVVGEKDENIYKSARNIPGMKVCSYTDLNVYDLLKYDNIAISKTALKPLQDNLLKHSK